MARIDEQGQMPGAGFPNFNRPRYVILAVLAFTEAVPLTDFFCALWGDVGHAIRTQLQALTIVCLTVTSIYLLGRIRSNKNIQRLVLLGGSLLVVSQTYRILNRAHFLDGILKTQTDSFVHRLDILMDGTGLVLVLAGFFFAIVELLRLRQLAMREIAERKLSEEALRISEAKYRELIENANSIIIRMTPEGRVTFLNDFAQRFLGYAESELLGHSVMEKMVNPESSDGAKIQAVLERAGRDPSAHANVEIEIVRRNGQRATIAWTNRPIFDDNGTYREVLCVGNDITAYKEAQHIITEQRLQMMAAGRFSELGVMASGVAHEVNNPLAIISVASENLGSMVASRSYDPEQMNHALEVVQRNVARIDRIVRGLRSLSSDGSKEPFKVTPLKNIIDDAIELCQARFRVNGISLSATLEDEATAIECRPTQISQVIINLLNNAYDAVEKLPDKWARIDVREYPECIELSVADSGQGLPKQIEDKILGPFFTTKEVGKGMGLGLSISRSIVASHHGELFVDKLCSNTRFVARLPKTQPLPVA